MKVVDECSGLCYVCVLIVSCESTEALGSTNRFIHPLMEFGQSVPHSSSIRIGYKMWPGLQILVFLTVLLQAVVKMGRCACLMSRQGHNYFSSKLQLDIDSHTIENNCTYT